MPGLEQDPVPLTSARLVLRAHTAGIVALGYASADLGLAIVKVVVAEPASSQHNEPLASTERVPHCEVRYPEVLLLHDQPFMLAVVAVSPYV